MTWLTKIRSGGDQRKSRLHTESNDLVSLRDALVDLPTVFGVKLMSVVTGRRPSIPWWPTRVLPIVDAFLRKSMDAIEFGSGSSSIWTARRVGSLLSVEDDAHWGIRTRHRLKSLGLQHAQVQICSNADYWTAGAPRYFDFAVVDGSWRWLCLEQILPRMRPGGLVYLDNADSDKDRKFYSDGESGRLAQRAMEDYVLVTPGARLDKVRSLIHGELFAGEGWLLWIP